MPPQSMAAQLSEYRTNHSNNFQQIKKSRSNTLKNRGNFKPYIYKPTNAALPQLMQIPTKPPSFRKLTTNNHRPRQTNFQQQFSNHHPYSWLRYLDVVSQITRM